VGIISDSADGPSRALVEHASSGDERARERLVRTLMPMAQRVARRFAGPQHPVEDLTQVAGIGLLKAIERFDPDRDATFATYAHSLMTGEVRRHIRDSRMVRIPRSIYEQVPVFQRTLSRLRATLGRDPSRQEIADEMGISKEDVIEIAEAAISAQHVSLDAAAEEAGGEFELGDVDTAFDRVEAGADLAPMLSVLTPRERMIIALRFEEGLSQSEIAVGLGLSQTQVSRLIRNAMAKLSRRAGVAA
jgi:RNA polymerase sigma factor (sigma-70 family)